MPPRRRRHKVSWPREFATEFAALCLVGLVVAIAMVPVSRLNTVKNIDRYALDVLVRNYAKERLGFSRPGDPRWVYIDISATDCETWAKADHASCTNSWSPGREHLTQIIETLGTAANQGPGPRLVLVDVDLTPRGAEDPADKALCKSLAALATKLPVVVSASLSIVPDVNGLQIASHPSILGTRRAGTAACEELRDARREVANLWLGSALLESDADGVVRSVPVSTRVNDEAEEQYTRIAGMGVLAAALLEPRADKKTLACLFPGSALSRVNEPSRCQPSAIKLQHLTYRQGEDEAAGLRPIFTLPYQQPGSDRTLTTLHSPAQILVVDAMSLQQNREWLPGAVVVIGGSWRSGGDLHPTPLGPDMPGAMIHANAARALMTGEIMEEHESGWLELALIALAATIGSLSHLGGELMTRRLSQPLAQLGEITVSLAGVAISVVLVLFTALGWAKEELALSGKALATMTPALAIGFEGLCHIVQAIRIVLRGWVVRALTPSQGNGRS
jgi:CHASE2 domain-containing sensor protein